MSSTSQILLSKLHLKCQGVSELSGSLKPYSSTVSINSLKSRPFGLERSNDLVKFMCLISIKIKYLGLCFSEVSFL